VSSTLATRSSDDWTKASGDPREAGDETASSSRTIPGRPFDQPLADEERERIHAADREVVPR